MALAPEEERRLIEEWKTEWRPLSLSELYELRKELIVILEEARRKDEEEPGRIPPYSYTPVLRVRAMNELIKEKGGLIPAGTVGKYLPWIISAVCFIGMIIGFTRK